MILNYLFFGSLVSALALIALSGWLLSRTAYITIIVLLASAFAFAEIRNGVQSVNPLSVGLDLLIFGAFYYFVTVQYLLKRRATEITSRKEFREFMETRQLFSGYVKAIYHLPVLLLLVAIAVAIVGAMTSQG